MPKKASHVVTSQEGHIYTGWRRMLFQHCTGLALQLTPKRSLILEDCQQNLKLRDCISTGLEEHATAQCSSCREPARV